MARTFEIFPVLLEDGPAVARCLHHGFKEEGFSKASFPTISIDHKGMNLVQWWPANYLALEAVLTKAVDGQSGELAGYAQ